MRSRNPGSDILISLKHAKRKIPEADLARRMSTTVGSVIPHLQFLQACERTRRQVNQSLLPAWL
jgi:hypothetical protein